MHRKYLRLGVGFALTAILCFMGVSCDRSPTSKLKGQSNADVIFYGKAVDQDGAPLPNVTFQFLLEAFPKDWSFATRGSPNSTKTLLAVTDANGAFQLKLKGHMLRMERADIAGYRQLEELDAGTRRENGGNSVYTRGISLVSWGDPLYKSDPTRPAIFVFVKDGTHQIKVLPSQGGFGSRANRWVENKAEWPFKPSLPDVDWADGQVRVNVDVPLVLKAVDTVGRPLAGVGISIEVERYRTIDEMKSSGYEYDRTKRTSIQEVSAMTGPNGLARATVHGFRLRKIQAGIPSSKRDAGPFMINAIGLYARELMDNRGSPIYRCDESNPMILVFAKPGEADSQAMPSCGGYELRDGSWQRVEASWPENPWPSGVRYSPSAARQGATTRDVAQ